MLGSMVIMTTLTGRRIRTATLAGAAALAVVFGSACTDTGENDGGGGGNMVENGGDNDGDDNGGDDNDDGGDN